MAEIKKNLIKLEEGKTYTAGPDQYLITEEHTLSDVLRYLVGQAGPDGWEDIQYLLNEYKPKQSGGKGMEVIFNKETSFDFQGLVDFLHMHMADCKPFFFRSLFPFLMMDKFYGLNPGADDSTMFIVTKIEYIRVDHLAVKVSFKEVSRCDDFGEEKPPPGLMPKKIYCEHRLSDVCAAISRYYNAGLKIPIEWIKEYNELLSRAGEGVNTMEKFIVKHYSSDERPIIKGFGFDGLEIGEDREDSEDFIAFVNGLLEKCEAAGIKVER